MSDSSKYVVYDTGNGLYLTHSERDTYLWSVEIGTVMDENTMCLLIESMDHACYELVGLLVVPCDTIEDGMEVNGDSLKPCLENYYRPSKVYPNFLNAVNMTSFNS